MTRDMWHFYLNFRYSLEIVTSHQDFANRPTDLWWGPAHQASETVDLVKVVTRMAYDDFIPPNWWPPNSPDPNPVDYKIWGVLQERLYKDKKSIKDVDELRRWIAEEW